MGEKFNKHFDDGGEQITNSKIDQVTENKVGDLINKGKMLNSNDNN